MSFANKFVMFMAAQDIVVALAYLFVSKDITRAIYWLAAGILTGSTVFLK